MIKRVKDKVAINYSKILTKAKFPVVLCTPKGERWLRSGHLWLYAADIYELEAAEEAELRALSKQLKNENPQVSAVTAVNPPAATLISAASNCSATVNVVDVFSSDGTYLGSGFYNDKSKIRVRLLSKNRNDKFDFAFFQRRIAYALNYRYQIKRQASSALQSCRLIFGEADGLPGLTVDCFAHVLVVEIFTQAIAVLWPLLQKELLAQLRTEYGIQIKVVYEKSLGPLRAKEGLPEKEGLLYVAEGLSKEAAMAPVVITENALQFAVDFVHGQKTGYFLDQKDNRALVQELAYGKNVLECFTHTGSFALNALKGGATNVVAVDISQTALEQARYNAALNAADLDLSKLTFVKADVFNLLTALSKGTAGPDWDLVRAEGPYDMILLDPPAFAKRQDAKQAAYRGYLEINKQAMQLLARGSYLVTTSCSHFMPEADFERMLKQAAALANVNLRLIAKREQAADHPILLHMPETAYLKTYFLQIV